MVDSSLTDDEPPTKKRRAARGSMLRVALPEDQFQGSDVGIKPYLAIKEGAIPLKFPPLDLRTLQAEYIYKGEMFCRWPGCGKRSQRYSQPTKLRTHYKDEHGYEWERSTVGRLGPAFQRAHDNGLEWLARCGQLGWENAGLRPPRPSRR